MLFGADAMAKLKKSKVAVFGIGGVGGYAVEALVRGGIGALDLFDGDVVEPTNINRQLHALPKTVGRPKVEAAKERALEINPDLEVNAHKLFFLPENSGNIDFAGYDYIIDAIDTISGKLELVSRARECGVPIICSMAAGNKVDPSAFRVADIYETSICPIAKVMRRELKKRGVERLKVVYSTEPPVVPEGIDADAAESMAKNKKRIPGSNSFVPPVAGFIIAGEVIKDLIGYGKK